MSRENSHNTAETAMETGWRVPRASLIARLAQIGVMIFCVSDPTAASASLPPRNTGISYANNNDTNNRIIYADAEEKCKESSDKVFKIGTEASLLISLTDSLDNPDKIVSMTSDFVHLAKEYGADAELIKSIFGKKNISKADKKDIIEQAKRITQTWSAIMEEHYKNLTNLYSILSANNKDSDDIKFKIKRTVETAAALAAHEKFLNSLIR